jgi:VWFA-related protein
MTRALAPAFALVAAAAAGQVSEQKPTFPAQTEAVTVDVVVTGRGGEPVVDLRREDFTIKEDGVVQEIVSFDLVNRPLPPATAGGAAHAAPEPRTSSNRDAAAREAASFVIVFDELHMDPAAAIRAREAVSRFLERSTAPRDQVAVVGTFEGTRWSARMPEGRAELLQVVARLQGRRVNERAKDYISDYEAMRIDQDRDPIVTDQVVRRFFATGEMREDTPIRGDTPDPMGDLEMGRGRVQALASTVYARNTLRDQQALGIIDRSLEALAGSPGRKCLVLVSGGIIQDLRVGAFHRIVNGARRANAAVYFLDSRGLSAATSGLRPDVGPSLDLVDRSTGAGLDEIRNQSEGSEALALDTGGLVIRNDNDLALGLDRIGREARSYYLVGYAPGNIAADGRFRKIEVKVARADVTVRARRGYYAPGKDAKPGGGEPRDAALQRALDAPFDHSDVPLRALAQVFGEAEPGKVRVMLTVEADIRSMALPEKGGAARGALDTLLVVAHRDTGDFTRFDQQYEMSLKPETRARYARTWFPLTRELKLAPGPYQARLVARDRESGRVGSVTHEFVVPAVSGLRVSSPLLSDRLREGAADARVPEPTALRSFPPTGMLHCRFEVYGAAKDARTGASSVSAGFAIRRSDGKFLAAAAPTPLAPAGDGSLSRSLGLPLEGAPPGRYDFIVLVTDGASGQKAEAHEPFVIEGGSGG